MGMIDTSDPVGVATTHAGHYWYRDGINEIGLGLDALGGAASSYLVHRSMTGPAGWPLTILAFAGLAMALGGGRMKRLLRERLTYPRIGYLSEKRGEPLSRRRKLMSVVLMLSVIALPLGLLYLADGPGEASEFLAWVRWLPFVAGPATLAATAADAGRLEMRRLWINAAILAVAGPAISLSISAPFLACAAFSLAYAIVSIASGTAALVSLVRHTPVAVE